MIDLRTDTITLPSPEMRQAMADAQVGDDFYGEDPTIRALEAEAASALGKDAALYVPSGTMGNLIAHLTHAPAGGEVVGPESAHSFLSEAGGPARVAGMMIRTYPQVAGELDIGRIEQLIRPGSVLAAPTVLVWVEQPTRGFVIGLEDLGSLRRLADKHGLPIHFDGARIFNAAVALGVQAREIAAFADTVMFCVSKGLAAPVGSLVVGNAAFIERARVNRQMLGGGMRQAGIVAAGGLYALHHNVARLADDHANARRLADGLRSITGIRVDRETVETNILYADILRDDMTALEFVERLRDHDVLINRPAAGRRTVRFVTHYGIEADDIEMAIDAIRSATEGLPVGQAASAAPAP
ncbi:MAG TPA: GntG family PLP-dependent aldolase [Candidatus Limnocylindrales bacterium]|jgi:threonine aldolase|nr:GntG family PLP-dependent aldolase [Candidatus Limnocylindrales bacterium]